MNGRILQNGKKPQVHMWYPHMLPADASTWTRALQLYRHNFQAVWYDVHVGKAVEPPEGSPEYIFAVAAGVSRKRIDVIIERPGDFLITEVKPYGSHDALGQSWAYLELVRKEFQLSKTSKPCVVCDRMDHDYGKIAQEWGVVIYETGFIEGMAGGIL